MNRYTSAVNIRVFISAAAASWLYLAANAGAQTANTAAVQQCDCTKVSTNLVAAKVISWDKGRSLLVVNIGGKVQRVKITPGMLTSRVTVKGHAPELSPGQQVSLVLRKPLEDGNDIACVIIEPGKAPLEAAGSGSTSLSPAAPAASPFEGFANPANTSGRVISPHR